jgi:hypothetical protein
MRHNAAMIHNMVVMKLMRSTVPMSAPLPARRQILIRAQNTRLVCNENPNTAPRSSIIFRCSSRLWVEGQRDFDYQIQYTIAIALRNE